MPIKSRILLEALAPLTAFGQTYGSEETKGPGAIQWGDCPPVETNVTLSCGVFPVPLDYTNENNGQIVNLTLVKAHAVKGPSKGTIIFNPGGPGESGITHMLTYPDLTQVLTGGQHDVISFDPRGVGETLPFTCYEDPTEGLVATLVTPKVLNISDASIGQTFAIQKTAAATCALANPEIGNFLTTGDTARDIQRISEAVNDDGMIRFFGQSYGSYLGSVLGAMFPEKIEKLVIDGVIDPFEYQDGWETKVGTGSANGFKRYLELCVEAGPTLCPLAKNNATAKSIESAVYAVVEESIYDPIVFGPNITTDVVFGIDILARIDGLLRVGITTGAFLGPYLDAVLERNATAFQAVNAALAGPAPEENEQQEQEQQQPAPVVSQNALIGIRCGDQTFRTDKLSDIKAKFQTVADDNEIWAHMLSSIGIACSAWKFEPKGRYEGDFKAKTKNPALVVGSPYDVRTPISGAKAAASALEGSVVLQYNALGHCIMFGPGKCAIKAVQDYFNEGKLPEEGTVCEQDGSIFEGLHFARDFFSIDDL